MFRHKDKIQLNRRFLVEQPEIPTSELLRESNLRNPSDSSPFHLEWDYLGTKDIQLLQKSPFPRQRESIARGGQLWRISQ